MVLTKLVRLFDSSIKVNHCLRFYCTIVQYISLYIWDIAATAESISGRRFCALFEYVLHYPQGNESTGDIRSSWVDVNFIKEALPLCITYSSTHSNLSRSFPASFFPWFKVVHLKKTNLEEQKNVIADN